MKKKYFKYLFLSVIVMFVFFSIYKYSNPKIYISKEIVEKNISVKINVYLNGKFGDSVVVFLPYRFKIQNNRMRKIEIGDFYYRQNDYVGYENTLRFEDDGTSLDVILKSGKRTEQEKLLLENKFLEYIKLENKIQNIGIVFPFSSKTVYYYKSYRMSKDVFDKEISKEEYKEIMRSFHNQQRENLLSKSPFSISQKIIDSLYKSDENQKLSFTFRKKTEAIGFYEINYQLSNDNQKFLDYYDFVKNMTIEEFIEFRQKPIYED